MTAKETPFYDADKQRLICNNEWNLAHLPNLEKKLTEVTWPTQGEITIDGSAVTNMDSAGAWLLNKKINELKQIGLKVKLENFSKESGQLLKIIEHDLQQGLILPERKKKNILQKIGEYAEEQFYEARNYLNFVGLLTFDALRILLRPDRWRWNSLAATIYKNGYLALPIIALLSFLIGVVIAYQMGLQLKNYGANTYIVDLLGLAVLREFGPLLTAIMVAGRTGSSFTAQLGMMKLNQEIDVLDTMGVTPGELLLLPRIIGLFVALPLLTMWADVFGIVGGMVMANNMLNVTWYDFLHRFPHVVPLRHFLIGIGKAPVFALIIASIGCFEGMQVEGGAECMGKNTTRSVVLAIFFIIVADAIFSVLFSKLKL